MNSIQNKKESLTAYSGEQNFKMITPWISDLKMLKGKNKLDNNNTLVYQKISIWRIRQNMSIFS